MNITDLSDMFKRCKLQSSLPDISEWKTSLITDISNIFKGYELLSSLPWYFKMEYFLCY